MYVVELPDDSTGELYLWLMVLIVCFEITLLLALICVFELARQWHGYLDNKNRTAEM